MDIPLASLKVTFTIMKQKLFNMWFINSLFLLLTGNGLIYIFPNLIWYKLSYNNIAIRTSFEINIDVMENFEFWL